MFAVENTFLARLSAATAEMSSEKDQKHTYAQEHQPYYYYNNLRGHLEKESETVSDILNTAGVEPVLIGNHD